MDEQRIPIIVGVGQFMHKPKEIEETLEPLEMIKICIRRAGEDTEANPFLHLADSVRIVGIFSWSYSDIPSMVAEHIGASPHEKIYTNIGGNNPQFMVSEIAERISKGEINISLLCGAEASYSVALASRLGKYLPWPDYEGVPTIYGEVKRGTSDVERRHGLHRPIQGYPLFENALREYEELSIEENMRLTSEMCAAFAKVARANPYAWFKDGKSAEEIRTVTPDNRMISFPYPKYMNAIWNVDLASAIILTNVATAKKLAIPREKWIFVQGVADCWDAWHPIDKLNYHTAPGIKIAADQALQQAGVTIDDVEVFDLYSCFPCAPKLAKKMMGIRTEDWESLTVTGGLAYFGGPGNNYPSHAICSMVERLRGQPEKIGLVYGIGWFMTKHSIGIYSAGPKEEEFGTVDRERMQREVEGLSYPEFTADADGAATLETFTVMHDREGRPDYAIIIGRLDDGRRFIANTATDLSLFDYLMTNDVVGLKGRVKHSDKDEKNIFEVA